MMERIKRSITLINLMKFIGLIMALIFLLGLAAGFINLRQAGQEKSDMMTVNTLLEEQGLSDEVKKASQDFIKKYPRTKNIIVCDSSGNIVYKANEQIVGGKDKFELKPDRERPDISKLKDGKVLFMRVPKGIEPFSLVPRPWIGGKSVRSGDMSDYFTFKAFGQGRGGIKGDHLFIINFQAAAKDLNIYYLSGNFHENNLMEMIFISHGLLRLLMLVFWIMLAVWVYRDSKTRGLHQVFWGLLTLFTGLIGLVIYLITKHRMEFCRVCSVKIDKDANYCPKCGAAAKMKCTACEHITGIDANYCPNCGNRNQN